MRYLFTKKIMLVAALFFAISFGYGQGRVPNGIIVGQVVDQVSGQGLEYATISVFTKRDSTLIGGEISDRKGKFTVTQVPGGYFYIEINFMGYEPVYVENVKLFREKKFVDIGKISLVLASENLDEVTVTGRADYVVNKIDRKAYNISKLLVAEGGTADEVLQLIPSVEVDIDGNISLRGSGNVTVLIDGKPSGITGNNLAAYLESLPANTLETIEVITNPSAKYDPDGMVGILNIVTKKKKLQGVHGSFSAAAGIPARHNLSAMFNAKTGRWNFLLNGGVNYRDGYSIGDTYRENYFNGGSTILTQQTDGDRKGPGGMFRIGTDYNLSRKSTLSAGGSYNFRIFTSQEDILTENANSDGDPFDIYTRNTEGGLTFDMFRYNLGFNHQFNNEGHELLIDVSQSVVGHEFTGTYLEMPFSLNLEPLNYVSFRQNNRTISDNKTSTIQVDYTFPINENSIFEAGYKSIFNNTRSDFFSESFDSLSNDWMDDINLINDFISKEQIHSVYSVYKQNIKKFGYQIGLRMEQSVLDAELVTTRETFHNDYLSLFPSVHLNYQLQNGQQLKASYSRRLNRPNHRVLNPFANYADPLNLRKGNPFIYPEYIDSYEIEYEKTWNKFSVTTALYFKQINDMITRIKTVEGNVSTTSYENLGMGRNYGVELILRGDLTKWWNFTLSANGYKIELEGEGKTSELNADGYAFTSKLLMNMYLPKKFNVQISVRYRSPKVLAQGEISEIYSTDIALSKKVMDNKGTISLKTRDIFNTRSYRFTTEGENFYQESYRKRQSQSVQLGFAYRFGRFKNRGGRKGGGERGGMEGEDIGID